MVVLVSLTILKSLKDIPLIEQQTSIFRRQKYYLFNSKFSVKFYELSPSFSNQQKVNLKSKKQVVLESRIYTYIVV